MRGRQKMKRYRYAIGIAMLVMGMTVMSGCLGDCNFASMGESA